MSNPSTKRSISHTHGVNRRRFLGVMGSAVAIPWIVPASALGQTQRAAPSERITIGFIGTGKMANDYHLPEILRMKDAQALAVCEVDEKRRAHAKKRIDDTHQLGGKGCDEYVDFR